MKTARKFFSLMCAAVMLAASASPGCAADSALTQKQQSIIEISSHTACGRLENLKEALGGGLNAGLTVSEIREVLVQLYAYTGFPRSLNGINTFMAVMDERRSQGIKDEEGKEASPEPADWDRDAYGAQVRARLGGRDTIPEPSGYQLFAPVIDRFLKEHLFADIFVRDNLDHQSRELATIAALGSMQGLGVQLKFHLNAALNTGLNEAQLREFILVLKDCAGESEVSEAEAILTGVLAARAQ